MPLSAELGIEIVSFRLDSLLFRRYGPVPAEPKEVDAKVGIGVTPPKDQEISVRLEMILSDETFMRVGVAFVVVLRRTEHFKFEGSVEDGWKHIASRLAPVLLYPFVRETIVSTLQKAGLDEPIPPILDFRHVFNPADISFTEELAEQPS